MIDINELNKRLEDALKKETPESIVTFIMEQRGIKDSISADIREFRNDVVKKKLLYGCYTRQEREETLMYLYAQHILEIFSKNVKKNIHV